MRYTKVEERVVMIKYIALLLVVLAGCNNSSDSTDNFSQPKNIVLANPVKFDSTQWSMGEYNLQSATLKGDILTLNVSCSGNSPKDFELVAWNYWLETDPVQAYALLSFKPDTINTGSVVRVLTFDLTPLKKAYNASYRSQSGVIIFRLRYLEPSRVELRYEF